MSRITKYCYGNGDIMKERDLRLSPYDLGVLRGYGVFDFMATANRLPFHLDRHWRRFLRGARLLGLKPPLTKAQFTDIVTELIAKHPTYAELAIRTVLTGGVSVPTGILLPQTPTFYILVHDLISLLPSKTLYDRGARVITKNYQRPYANVKTVHYIEALRFQRERLRKNAAEILYHDGTRLAECSTANVFIVKNGTVLTPPPGTILPGVVRDTVIALAKKHRVPLKERHITLRVLDAADEMFITGSAKHILPVTRVDNRRVGDGAVGPVTRALMDIYRAHYAAWGQRDRRASRTP